MEDVVVVKSGLPHHIDLDLSKSSCSFSKLILFLKSILSRENQENDNFSMPSNNMILKNIEQFLLKASGSKEIQMLKTLSDIGNAANSDLVNIENATKSSQIPMHQEKSSPVDEVGLSGQPITYATADTTTSTITEGISPRDSQIDIECIQNPPFYRNPDFIRSKIDDNCQVIDNHIKELKNELENYVNRNKSTDNSIMAHHLGVLENVYVNLVKTRKLERRYQDLAFVGLCQKEIFTSMDNSFRSFFECLRRFQDVKKDDDGRLKVLFEKTVQSACILESSMSTTLKMTKASSGKSQQFDLTLRIHGIPDEDVKCSNEIVPILTLTSEDESHVKCNVRYDHKSALFIGGIKFEDFHSKTAQSRLAHYQHFYVLNLKQKIRVYDNTVELKCKTSPFATYTAANQQHASSGSVIWNVFSQDEDDWELKIELPWETVLQMFNLLAKNIAKNCVKGLDKTELTELRRLVKNQIKGNTVTMASIFHNFMKHPRDGRDLEFSFYTWFQACLNTLTKFKDFWTKGLLVGFYSCKDCDNLLASTGFVKGDTLVRLSQTMIRKPQSNLPLVSITVHCVMARDYIFIDCFSVKEETDICKSLSRYSKKQRTQCVVRLLPTKINFSDVLHDISQSKPGQTVEINRYLKAFRENPTTIEPIQRSFESLAIDDSPITTSFETPAPSIPTTVEEMESVEKMASAEEMEPQAKIPRFDDDLDMLPPSELQSNSSDPFLTTATSGMPDDLYSLSQENLITTQDMHIDIENIDF